MRNSFTAAASFSFEFERELLHVVLLRAFLADERDGEALAELVVVRGELGFPLRAQLGELVADFARRTQALNGVEEVMRVAVLVEAAGGLLAASPRAGGRGGRDSSCPACRA